MVEPHLRRANFHFNIPFHQYFDQLLIETWHFDWKILSKKIDCSNKIGWPPPSSPRLRKQSDFLLPPVTICQLSIAFSLLSSILYGKKYSATRMFRSNHWSGALGQFFYRKMSISVSLFDVTHAIRCVCLYQVYMSRHIRIIYNKIYR